MATVVKDFKLKAGLVVEGSTATVNGKNVITAGIVDAKGDLIVGSADDAVARLAAGTNGYVLTANSGATNGLEWAAPAAVGSFGASIEFEGSTADNYETTLAVVDPTADRTITLPNATGTVVLKDTTDTLTNKSISLTTNTVTGTKAEFNAAMSDADFASLAGAETLTNKTLTSPTITGTGAIAGTFTGNITGDVTGNVSGSSGSTTGNAATVTNGVYTTSKISVLASTSSAELAGVISDETGSGNLVFSTSPTLVTPVLGVATATSVNGTTIPSSKTLVVTTDKLNALAATSSSELAGIISDETGTGALVFANTPTLVTPNIGAATGTSLVLSGDLTVNGTTTTINSTEITIDDKNMTLGAVTSPTDAGADGGGLTLKGTTDKTFNYVNATTAWTSSEHMDLASGKVLKVAGTQVLSATEYTGNAATVTNGVYTTSKISALAATSSSELAGVISDETGTGALVFANTPTLVTPVIGAATGTTLVLSGALTGTAITLDNSSVGSATATAGTSATTIDTWSATDYTAAKYIVQLKKNNDIEVIEVLVAVNGTNDVYLTEYADVQSNGELGTTNAVYSGGNVLLQVTAAASGTAVKVHRTYIEA